MRLSCSIDFRTALKDGDSFLQDKTSLSHLIKTGSCFTSRPYSLALYSRSIRRIRQPASAITLESFRFFSIPDTFGSSTTTAWFSRMSRVLSLWRWSNRWSATLA